MTSLLVKEPQPATSTLGFFAPCARGLEASLAAELSALGATEVETTQGGVQFAGDRALGYRANLYSRLASRILLKLDSVRYRNGDDLYKLAARQTWETIAPPGGTLRVDLNASHSRLRSLNFALLRIKDGIVDQLRTSTGSRPSINTERPDWRVFVHLEALHAHLYLDWTGESLFKRGWRNDDLSIDSTKGAAPLKETLAAGLLHLSGWVENPGPLLDPFCGSGTILIEAAQIQAGIAAGHARNFAFEALPDLDHALWTAIRDEAQAAISLNKLTQTPCIGMDQDASVLSKAKRNWIKAGLPAEAAQWVSGNSLRKLPSLAAPEATPPGMLVTNPPYGQRLQDPGQGGWRDFAGLLKQSYPGSQCWMLSGDLDLPKQLGLRESRKIPLMNGTIECRLFGFSLR